MLDYENYYDDYSEESFQKLSRKEKTMRKEKQQSIRKRRKMREKERLFLIDNSSR